MRQTVELWLKTHPWVVGAVIGVVIGLVLRWFVRYRVTVEVERALASRRIKVSLNSALEADWAARLNRSQSDMEARVRRFEEHFTEEMRDGFRQVLLAARTEGVPLQVRVVSRREADVVRAALGGQVVLRVSRRPRQEGPPETDSDPPPDTEAPQTVWDRLAADEEAPCPTPTSPPPRRPRKKT